MITEFIVATGERTKRLDAFLVNHERRVSRSSLQRLIMAGRIRVNAQVTKPSQKVKPGDRITMDSPEPGPMMVNDRVVPLEILYEDDGLILVNKPAGVVVHPTSGNWKGTLLNGLLAHFQTTNSTHESNQLKKEPGLVHRLDKETSGIMVVAKTDQAHQSLCRQFEKQKISRTYEALVHGKPTDDHGTIDVAIGRDASDGKKVSTQCNQPQTALTDFRVLQRIGQFFSLVELTPRTGRQHQLRVHMAWLGCPILGDPVYGNQEGGLIPELTIPRMMLHATRLGFQHPVLETYHEYISKTPDDFMTVPQM